MKIEIVFKDGRKETFESVASFTATEEQPVNQESNATEVAQGPIEGKPFEVNPLVMDRSVFKEPQKDQRQEWTRQIINEAFAEVDKQPEKYAEAFYTLIPAKAWDGCKTVDELKEYAKDLDGQMADWIQQALEWGQRICNGESWKRVSIDADTAKWFRIIIWKNGFCRIVGGSRNNNDYHPASDLRTRNYNSYNRVYDTVPLVALKKKK